MISTPIDVRATAVTRARYQRLAPMYDRMEVLSELKRVVKPGGQLILLEHMRSPHVAIGKIMDVLNPLVVRVMGANINRRTVENVRSADWSIEEVQDLGMGGIVKLIIAHF